MKATAILVGLCLAVGGCNTVKAPQHQRISLTPEQIAKVQEGVKADLADPQSADFGPIYGGRYSAEIIGVCGYVNGRNRMGGMTGLVPFRGALRGQGADQVYQGNPPVVDPSVELAVVQTCRAAGIMPPA